MPHSLTFAELYQQKRLRGMNSFTKGSRENQDSQVTSSEDIDKIVTNAVHTLEEDPRVTVKNIKHSLKHIPDVFLPYVTSWSDINSLDILHYAIINNKPDVVDYLLENNYFPKTHMPKLNPYAHLAATLGHKECLRVVLQYRPGDFFNGFLPCHAIKLPDDMTKRLKISDTMRSGMHKSVDKLLDKIKSSTETAEKALQAMDLPEASDVGAILGEELGALEKKTRKGSRSRKFKAAYSTFPSNKPPSSTDEKAAHGKHHPPDKTQSDLKKVKKGDKDKAEDLESHMIPKLNSHRGQHLITVFWDALSAYPPGVVKGAGLPVKVKYTSKAQTSRPQISLDRMYKPSLPSCLSEKDRLGQSAIGLLDHNRSRIMSKSQVTITASDALQKAIAVAPGNKTSAAKKFQGIEVGVRGKKKYKDFTLKIEHKVIETKDDSYKYMNKTPLTLAAERGHIDCVQLMLDMIVMKNNPMMVTKEPLTLATKARCPEAIMLLLDKRMTRLDYQSAVLTAIRELFPDCLSALLSSRGKERQALFDGINLFHILYSQSLISDYRYEMMPEMTRVLISCREDVNSHNVPRTFPMYTLINCAFNITIGKQILFYIECLNILLDAKANPHFNEEKAEKMPSRSTALFTRQPYTSAVNCILESAKSSVNFFESTYWSKIFMKKFLVTIETGDRTSRRILNDVLFEYMRSTCTLGLDRSIIKSLLRYGGNPDFKNDGKYAINVYFDEVLPYLTKFEVINSYNKYQNELDNLMVICRGMTHRYLAEALLIFLDEHLLTTPLQALPICRYFSYLINQRLKSPRPLSELISNFIWVRLRRNVKRARQLPLPIDLIALVIP